MMTSGQFRKIALKLFGPDRGWQSRCAKKLGVDRASVSRWLSHSITIIPGPAAAAMTGWNETFQKTGAKPF